MPPSSRPTSSSPHPDNFSTIRRQLDDARRELSRLESLRELLASERRRDNSLHQVESRRRATLLRSPPSTSDSRRFIRSSSSRARNNPSHSTTSQSTTLPFSSPTPPINRSRHFATPSRFFRNRHHQRRPRPATPPSGRAPATQNDALSSTELREAGEQLAQINQNLRNLLERPLDDRRRRFGDVDRSRAEVDLDQVARKRRRMDQETSAKMCPRITYGFHGQIAPGRLKMEVSDALHGIDAVDTVASNQNHDLLQPHPVQNVVKNDKTIYAAPGSQCNIVLQHPGLTGFTVKRIIIKTPRHPVAVPKQILGLAFVSNVKDACFDRTLHYQMYDYPSSRLAPASTAVSDDDDANDPGRGLRPHTVNARFSLSSSPPDLSEDDLDSGTVHNRARSSFYQHVNHRDALHHSSNARQPYHPSIPASNDDNEAYDNILSQFEFDQVLNRGANAYTDRQERRRAARERARTRQALLLSQRASTESQRRQSRSRHQYSETTTRTNQFERDGSDVDSTVPDHLSDPSALHAVNLSEHTPRTNWDNSDLVNELRADFDDDDDDADQQIPRDEINTAEAFFGGYDGTQLPGRTGSVLEDDENARRPRSLDITSFHTEADSLEHPISGHSTDAFEAQYISPAAYFSIGAPSAGPTPQATRNAHVNNSSIEIAFDTPPSGRYLLLKLWRSLGASGHFNHGANEDGENRDEDVGSIGNMMRVSHHAQTTNEFDNDGDAYTELDSALRSSGTSLSDDHVVKIQSVIVEGWCGTRFFPALQMR